MGIIATWAQPGQRTLEQQQQRGGAGKAKPEQHSARVGGSRGCCAQIGQEATGAPRAHRR